MRLYHAFGISAGSVVAFVGAGGKSSAILDILAELTSDEMSVLVAPTTKMFLDEARKIGPLITSTDQTELRDGIEKALGHSRRRRGRDRIALQGACRRIGPGLDPYSPKTG